MLVDGGPFVGVVKLLVGGGLAHPGGEKIGLGPCLVWVWHLNEAGVEAKPQ